VINPATNPATKIGRFMILSDLGPFFILTLKTWSSLRAVRPTGWKLGQVRVKWLCYNQNPWGTGILECWNTGFGGLRSIFI
jgi:hypothetical protein